MVYRSRWSHYLFTLVLLSAIPAAGTAQVESVDVPIDLVLALLGGQGQDTRVLVGAVPPEVEGLVPLGEVERVVGGLVQRSGGTVVVQVPGNAREALANYVEHLQGQGWARPVMPDDERGGFRTTMQFGQDTWCGEGYSIRGSSLTFDSKTYLRVRYTSRVEGRNVCDPPEDVRAMARRDPFGGLRFPSLEPPPGAVVRGGGGGGGSNGIDMEVTVESSLPGDVIFEHYAQQLTAAGWIPEGRAIAEDVSIARWRTQDEEGEPVVGTLGIWALMGEDSYRAWARMDRVDRRR